jgi:hypothetical protein
MPVSQPTGAVAHTAHVPSVGQAHEALTSRARLRDAHQAATLSAIVCALVDPAAQRAA